MKPGRIFWKLFLGHAVLMVALLATLGWITIATVDRFSARDLTQHLHTQAAIVAEAIGDRFDAAHAAELEQFARRLHAAQTEAIRFTLILADGRVIMDSEADPSKMGPHADREEVRQALIRGWGENTRRSKTLARDTKYVAVRVGGAEHPAGVVRVAMPLYSIAERTRAEHKPIWMIALAGITAVVLLALGLARLWSRPIGRITLTAESLSRGDLSARVPVTGQDELAVLARSLNQMRDHLAAQLETIDKQRRVLESILAQISEGVVVAGPDGRIVLLNPAARRLLGLPVTPAYPAGPLTGRTVEDCVLQGELRKALIRDPAASAPVPLPAVGNVELATQELRLQVDADDGQLSLLARACDVALPGLAMTEDQAGESALPIMGRLLVLTDITELSRLIQMKADFAANTSHELRTPLSAIRGAVETLLDMDFADDPQSARRFLGVIDRHSSRMLAMITDLLNLSRLETATNRFESAAIRPRELLAELEAHFRDILQSKKLRWQADVEGPLDTIVVNHYLLRLTLDNLVDNAAKFTDADGLIKVTCRTTGGPAAGPRSVSIEVADTGCGIPEEEQSRVFERFYQVERARSGGVTRGTGLGLSIVRHAVAAMQGTLALRSKVGEGTTVTISIPQPV